MEESAVANNVEMRVQLMFPDMHTKEFQCAICAKYFSRKFTLDAHMLIHKGEKPHACPFCGKCFRQKGTLMRHKALHSTKNLFHCSLCKRGFRQKNVFIHHLKHRHNVSVEALDRRKYRTELKDYQSIMDTLPPFVQADSTAIASSEKHFDAVLFESMKMPGDDSATILQGDYSNESNLTNVQNDVLGKSCYSENLPQRKNINLYMKEGNILSLKNNSYGSNSNEEIHNQENAKEIKPAINSDFSKMNASVYPPQTFNCSALVTDSNNLLSSQSSNVTVSNYTSDENLICIPCQLSFTSEVEFKCHVKTHVQSVLQGDMSSTNHKYTDLQEPPDADLCIKFKNGFKPSINMLGPVSPVHSGSVSNQADSPDYKLHKEENVPVKVEILDSEVESPSSSNKNEFDAFESSYLKCNLPDSQFKCPVCEATLQGDRAFKNHCKKHDSYSLLKFICELLRSPCIDQDQVSSSRVANYKKYFLNEHVQNSRRNLKGTSLTIRRPVKRINQNSRKFKSVFRTLKCIQCKKKFSSKLLLEYHRQLHLRSKGFICKCCKRGFSSKQLLLSHTRIYHLKAFQCSKCSRIFSYQKLFQLHVGNCKASSKFKTSNGSSIDFPVVDIESLLNSDMEGIVGVIPVCNSVLSGGIKLGIPVMSVSQVKALHAHHNEV